jgi:hypothetical protein
MTQIRSTDCASKLALLLLSHSSNLLSLIAAQLPSLSGKTWPAANIEQIRQQQQQQQAQQQAQQLQQAAQQQQAAAHQQQNQQQAQQVWTMSEKVYKFSLVMGCLTVCDHNFVCGIIMPLGRAGSPPATEPTASPTGVPCFSYLQLVLCKTVSIAAGGSPRGGRLLWVIVFLCCLSD